MLFLELLFRCQPLNVDQAFHYVLYRSLHGQFDRMPTEFTQRKG